MHQLQFNAALTAANNNNTANNAPGKRSTIPTSDLLKRLKALHTELKVMEQENTDIATLSAVSQELISASLLNHKDKGVKSLVACCLADLLRLYAPDAPFTSAQQNQVFEFLLEQLHLIADIDGPYFAYSYYLLEMLANVKSLILVIDLDGADEMLRGMFQMFFSSIVDKHPKAVLMAMLDIMHQMVEEMPTLKPDLVTVILNQFAKSVKTKQPAAHQLACSLITNTVDRLQFYVCQHFNDILLSAHQKEDDIAGVEYKKLELAHSLIQELHQACDGVLLSVIPQLESELHFEAPQIRQLSITLLGNMFSERSSALAKNYPVVWLSWLGKRNDPDVELRVLWLSFSAAIMCNHREHTNEICNALLQKLMDPDDKVRVAAVSAIGKLVDTGSIALLDSLPVGVLKELGARSRDKKASVRHEAIPTLSKIYSLVYPEFLHSSDSLTRYGDIPSTLVSSTLVFSDNSNLVDECMGKYILPSSEDMNKRGTRLLLAYASMNDQSRSKFLEKLFTQNLFQTRMKHLIDLCVDGVKKLQDDNFKQSVLQACSNVAAMTPDPARYHQVLKSMSELKDLSLFSKFKKLLNAHVGDKSMATISKDLLKKSTATAVFATISSTKSNDYLISVCGSRLFTDDLVPFLIHVADGQTPVEELRTNRMSVCAQYLIQRLSKKAPSLFTSHIDMFGTAILSAKTVDNCLVAFTGALRYAIASARSYKPLSRDLRGILLERAMSSPGKCAKHSALSLNLSLNSTEKADFVSSLVANIRDTKPNNESGFKKLAASFESLAAIVHVDTKVVSHLKDVRAVCINILTEAMDPRSEEEEDVWLDEKIVSDECRAKVAVIKFIGQVYSIPTDLTHGDKRWQMLFKLVHSAVVQDGNVCTDANQPTPHGDKTRIRLQAAISLNKCDARKALDKIPMVERIQQMSVMMQDPCYDVRERYITVLIKSMKNFRLGIEYFSLLFLAAFEPEQDLKNEVKECVGVLLNFMRSKSHTLVYAEKTFWWLIHTLAHHPDFGMEREEFQLLSKYIEFFVDLVATSSSVSYLFEVTNCMKTVEDRADPANSQNTYVLSELAQAIITRKSTAHQWPVTTYQGKVDYPRDLYKKLGSHTAQQVSRTRFLPAFQSENVKPVVTNTTSPIKSEKKVKSSSRSSKGASPPPKRAKKTIAAVASSSPPDPDRIRPARSRAAVVYEEMSDEE